MPINRSEIVGKLERVAPALSGNDLIPVFTHFCFTKGVVIAYNDQIGISTPCKLDFDGCISGPTLLGLLNASRADTVSFVASGKNAKEVIVKAASSKFKLPMMQDAAFTDLFAMPKAQEKIELPVDTKEFMAAIECCMRSVSIDTSVPDQLGVTLQVDGKDLLLFSTDNATLSHGVVTLKSKPVFKRVILSGHFCKQLLALVDLKKPLHLQIDDAEGEALYSGQNITLFGKLIETTKPVDFLAAVDRHLPVGIEKQYVSIPTKLEMIIDRACIIAAANLQNVRTQIDVKGSEATFSTTSPRGEVHDTLKLEGKHKDVSLDVDPKMLKRGYGSFDKMLITDNAFIMATKTTTYLVGS
jgi:DNA polymerase III sliding clamp (beta) subunit (PCNA family)